MAVSNYKYEYKSLCGFLISEFMDKYIVWDGSLDIFSVFRVSWCAPGANIVVKDLRCVGAIYVVLGGRFAEDLLCFCLWLFEKVSTFFKVFEVWVVLRAFTGLSWAD